MTGVVATAAGATVHGLALASLLRSLNPVLKPGVWAFCSVDPAVDLDRLEPIASVREPEGVSVIVDDRRAAAAGLEILFRAAWITLELQSDLHDVGLTAAVSTRLAAAGIGCNLVAGSRHDHLFVPIASADAALAALLDLQSEATPSATPPALPQPAALLAAEPLREALDRMGDCFVVLDISDCFVYANRAALKVLGRASEDQLLGRNIWSEFPLTVGTRFERRYREAAATQQMTTDEDHFSADEIWFESRMYPSPRGMSVYFSDITSRKRAEAALQRSELRYRLAAVHGQVWDWDLATDRVEFPLAFWQQLGWPAPPADQTVARLRELMHPDDRSRWQAVMRSHLQQQTPYQLEFRMRAADGAWRWFETQGLASRDADGRAVYMAGTTFDITSRAQALQALREAEIYRRRVFEQLADAVLLIDHGDDGRILDANPQALEMLGYERDELLSLGMPSLLAEHEYGRYAESVVEMRAGKAFRGSRDHRRKDGSLFPAEVSARVMDDSRFVAVIRDVTLRRESERVLMAIELELSALTQRLLSQERATATRIAQGLHDHLGQTLAVARLKLDGCIGAAGDAMPQALRESIGHVCALLDQAVSEVRQVLAGLRPPLLEEQGLVVALSDEIEQGAAAAGNADVLLESPDDLAGQRWPDDVEYCALMVAREAITNAQLHAGASLIRVVLEGGDGSLGLDVIDDGKGIPAPMRSGRPGHLGIVGMRERSIAIGAQFFVAAEAAGGTRISLRWDSPAA